MLSEELKSIDELIMLKHFLETEEKYEGQEREVKAIETVLNLITKLQKENEGKDRILKVRLDYEESYAKLRKQYEELISANIIKNEEIKQKDKQIDLMAEFISRIDIEEDICMKNKSNPDWCNEDYTNCKNCIKQYFETKVKKGE